MSESQSAGPDSQNPKRCILGSQTSVEKNTDSRSSTLGYNGNALKTFSFFAVLSISLIWYVIAGLSKMARIFNLLNSQHADEIISIIFMQLCSHRCVVVCSETCKLWRMIANQDGIWKDLCIRLWADKAIVPDCFRSMPDIFRSKDAYIGSLLDSKRTSISIEELTTNKFYFRFKQVVGRYWIEQDPFWTKNDPLRISFRSDGFVNGFPWDALQMKWHFVDDDGRTCQKNSSFMRVAINGRCVPTYMISRHSNWGIIIQVCDMLMWVVPRIV